MRIECDVERARDYGRKLKIVFDDLNRRAAEDLERSLSGRMRDPLENDTSYGDLIFALFDVGKALQQIVNSLDTQYDDRPIRLTQPVVHQMAIYGIIPPISPKYA